jgi:hypothetical protein
MYLWEGKATLGKENALLKKFAEEFSAGNPFVYPERYSRSMFSINDTLFKFASWGLACVALKYTALLLHSRSLTALFWVYDSFFCSSIAAVISATFIHPVYAAYSQNPKFTFAFFVILTLILLVITRWEIDKLITAAAMAKCTK